MFMQRRPQRKTIVQSLFEIIQKPKPLPQKKTLEAKALIQAILKLNQIKRQNIAVYEDLKQDFPETKIAAPQEINLDASNYTCGFGLNLLIMSAQNGHTTIMRALIDAKADVNFRAYSYTALSEAAKNGHRKSVRELIIYGKANINALGRYNSTALSWASFHGHEKIVRDLIVLGAQDLPQEKAVDTALVAATLAGHRKIADHLIRHAHSDTELKDDKDKTALSRLLMKQVDNKIEMISLLLNHKAHVNDPEQLFSFLLTCDARNPDLLISLRYLCEQLNSFYQSNKELREKADDALEKLNALFIVSEQECLDTLVTWLALPLDLLRLITSYDAPLQRPQVGFFKLTNLLPKPAEHRQLTPRTLPPRCGCPIM
jgi:hypothetical protein